MAGISGCFKSKNGDGGAMASDSSGVMVNHEPSETNGECTGKKRSKFKNFKRFFARKKRKEPSSLGIDSELKSSKSSENVSKSAGNTLSRSDQEKGSKVSLGSKALSHDSIFVSESSDANEALGASQDSIHGRVKSLQLQLKQAIRLGSPPSLMCVKRTDDTGAMSEDDGLPCSPPECSSPHTASNQGQRDSLTSLDSQDEQRSSGVASPLVVIPADFSQAASPFSCLDNSAAKHRLGLRQKACNKRKPANRLEVKAESDSAVEERHVVPFPASLDGETPDTCEDNDDDDERQLNMEIEEDKEKPQKKIQPLPGDKEETEHVPDVSHSPDTYGLPESDLSGETAELQSLPSSRSSTTDSPGASLVSPAGGKVDLLDGDETESMEDEALTLGEYESVATEESTFLEEVLNSLNKPHALVTESVEQKEECEENVELEDLVKEVEDDTDVKAVRAEEEDTEDLKEPNEGMNEDEKKEGKGDADEEREADEEEGREEEEEEEEEVVESKEEEPGNYKVDPSSALLSRLSSEENDEDTTHITTVPLCDEDEVSEDEVDEEEEPEVELFISCKQEEDVCTEVAEEPEPFQAKIDVEETAVGNEEVDFQEERVNDEQETSMEDVTEERGEEQEVDLDEEMEEEELRKKDEEHQLEEWERRMKNAEQRVVDDEGDEETKEDKQDDHFSVKEEICNTMPECQEDGDAGFIVHEETLVTHEEDTCEELDQHVPQQEGGEEILDPEPDDEEQKIVDVVEMIETFQSSSPEPSISPLSESQLQSEEEDLSSPIVLTPTTAVTKVHIQLISPSSEKLPSLPTEGEDPVSLSAPPKDSEHSEAEEEKSPIKEEVVEEERSEGQLCEEDINRASSGPDQRKVRFNIATAWQRSLSSEDNNETSPVEPEKSLVEPEKSSSPDILESSESTFSIPQQKTSQELNLASEDVFVKVEGCPNNPFGVKLRKTSVLSRPSQEEEASVVTPTVSHVKAESPPQVSNKPLIPPIAKKPAIPKKPDVPGDSGIKTRRISEPASVCSGGSNRPSWISVAKQKQQIYKDHSLDVITVKKDEHDRKSSPPVCTSSAAVSEHRLLTPDKETPADLSKSSPLTEKDVRWISSPPAPVPPVSSKSFPAPPCPKPAPAALKATPPPPVLPHRGLSPCASVLSQHVHPLSLGTTPNLPACTSRTAPGQTVPKVPAQRGVPPPGLAQDEPPWMALAKKKAKAWSEMPQIVQ